MFLKRKKKVFISISLVFLVIFYFYEIPPISLFSNKANKFSKVFILGHKGSGSDFISQSGIPENSLEAAKYGLDKLDGIELDIQMSKDEVIFTNHSSNLNKCEKYAGKSIPYLDSIEIIDYQKCSSIKFGEISKVFQELKNYPTKKVSLDVKSFYFVNSVYPREYLNNLAKRLTKLSLIYGVGDCLLIESENAYFLSKVKELDPKITTFLSVFDFYDFNASFALSHSIDGLSIKYKEENPIEAEKIELYKSKGLIIQLWTINDLSSIQKAMALFPNYIQTDNILLN